MQTSQTIDTDLERPRRRRRHWLISVLLTLIAFFVIFAIGLALWDAVRALGAPSRADHRAATLLGTWSTSCENAQGLTVEFSQGSGGAVVGRIKTLGLAKQFGYRQGDEIIRLRPAPGGRFTGELYWRNTAREKRWQPMTLRIEGGKLRGTSASEHCYDEMARVR